MIAQEVAEFGGRCFLPDSLLPSDVALVFGMSDPQRPAHHAADLYHRGLAKKLVFTGGYNPKVGRTEAQEMARLATAAGVPHSAILVEDNARHTDENAEFSARLLAAQTELQLSSVLLLTMQFHLTRAMIAARRWLPDGVAFGWSCYRSRHYTETDWASSEKGWGDVASELEKIRRYYGIDPVTSDLSFA